MQPQAPAPMAQPQQMQPQQPQGEPNQAQTQVQAGASANPTQVADQEQPLAPIDELDAHLNSLPDEQKQFVADNLTPETAQLLGIILGPEAYQYFEPMADKTKALIPVPREEVDRIMAEMSQSQATQPTQGQPQPQQTPGGTSSGLMQPSAQPKM